MCARPGAPGCAIAASSTSRPVLTDLQRRVRGVVASLPEGAAVALAGGGALIVTGVVRRGTDDLDFFTAHPLPVAPMLDALEAGLEETGLRVTRLRIADTYARLLVESDTEATYVDLATDYRLMPALQTPEGLILADQELAANKTLALFSRAEARDYIDFQALARRFSLAELCDLAASKDGGFTPALLAEALDYVDERDRDTFDLDDDTYEDLVAFAKSTARELQELERVQDNPDGLSIPEATM